MLNNKPFLLKLFLALVIIETVFTVSKLAVIPADAKNAVLFGFSFTRLLLMSVLIVLILSALFLLGYVSTAKTRIGKVSNILDGLNNDRNLSVIFWILVSIFVFGILFLLTPYQRIGEAVFQRLLPVVILTTLLAFQTFIFQFVWLKRKLNFNFLLQWRKAYLSTGVTFVIAFLAWIFITWSKIGIVPEKAGWSPPGTPILPQQVLIALGIGFLLFLITNHWVWIKNLQKSDIAISIILWGLASTLWLNEPLRDWSYFTARPTPPNFEIYPYSDAALYDIFAQNYLIGDSIQYGLTHRPGYAVFLAFLHAVVGQNYDLIPKIQILILAIGPIALYLLASKLGSRSAGIIAALILIFREKNAIALTNIIEVSHSKLLMSDVPTMILMILFLYFLINWLQNAEDKLHLGIIAGAFLGFAALVRSQALICIPIVFFCILIVKRKALKPALVQCFVFLLGIIVVTAPWVWRNYQISGRMVIEYQNAYTTVIASGYTDTLSDIDRLPGETVEAYDDRMFSMIFNYILENPLEVARFYTAYFVHNEISSIVYLPMSLRFWDARTYVRELNMWGWNPPFANPAPEILPLFFITLGIIALGIGIAYQRTKWIGLLPLFIHLGYSLSVVPFKTSGWRFILPVDWILALYFSIGLMHLTLLLFSLFNSSPQKNEDKKDPETKNILDFQKAIPVLGIFLIIGLAFPLVEKSIPEKYPALSQNELAQTYFVNDIVLENGEVITASALAMFLEAEPSSTVLYGRALYPSFYKSGDYWGDDDSYPLEMRTISRLQFLLIGPAQGRIYIPSASSPNFLPHGADVVVIGCKTQAGIRALVVKINNESLLVNTSPWYGLTCDLE